MGLSDQIVTPGQVIGAGGGGGGSATTDAGDLTSGTLDSARLPVVPVAKGGTGADLSSSSGVLQTIAGVVSALNAAGLRTFASLYSSAEVDTLLAGKAALSHTHSQSDITAGTLATPLQLGGSSSIKFTAGQTDLNSTEHGIWRDSAGQIRHNTPTGNSHRLAVAGSDQFHFGTNGVLFPVNQTITSSFQQIFKNNTALQLNVPSGNTLGFSVANVNELTVTATSVNVQGNALDGLTTLTGQGASGSVELRPASAGGGTLRGFGTSHATSPGQCEQYAAAVALANASARTVATSAASRTGGVRIIDASNGRQALYDVDGGTVTKVRGHAQFVVGTAGAGEVGLRNNAGTLEVHNNSGGSLNIGVIVDFV